MVPSMVGFAISRTRTNDPFNFAQGMVCPCHPPVYSFRLVCVFRRRRIPCAAEDHRQASLPLPPDVRWSGTLIVCSDAVRRYLLRCHEHRTVICPLDKLRARPVRLALRAGSDRQPNGARSPCLGGGYGPYTLRPRAWNMARRFSVGVLHWMLWMVLKT